MNRLTNNDKNWGPFTFARWNNYISAEISSGDDEDPENYILFVAFNHALRIKIPKILKPAGKYGENEKKYGFCISSSNGKYDFLRIYYGTQEDDSRKRKYWSYFFPWHQMSHIRHTLYNLDWTVFAELKDKEWEESRKLEEACPRTHFKFLDYDGTEIIATCHIEEREWHHGEKWCSWLRFFKPNFVRRYLELRFDNETGPGRGSWKGGIIGTSTDIKKGESPESAFKRYCEKEQEHKWQSFRLGYIGPCGPPIPKPMVESQEDSTANQVYCN